MPNKTTNYQLNQWSPEDNFLRTDFNEDNSNLETALTNLQSSLSNQQTSLSNVQADLNNLKPVCGSYTGLYQSNVFTVTTITLGFRPRMVYVMNSSGSMNDSSGSYCGLIYDGAATNYCSITITNTGFTVSNAVNQLNLQNYVYHYVAFR